MHFMMVAMFYFLVYFHCMGDNKGDRLAASHIVLYESALWSAYLFSHWFD